jgi:hypothetical protein
VMVVEEKKVSAHTVQIEPPDQTSPNLDPGLTWSQWSTSFYQATTIS